MQDLHETNRWQQTSGDYRYVLCVLYVYVYVCARARTRYRNRMILNQ